MKYANKNYTQQSSLPRTSRASAVSVIIFLWSNQRTEPCALVNCKFLQLKILAWCLKCKIYNELSWMLIDETHTTHSRSEQVLILPASGMWWQPSHTQLESSGGSRLRQVVTQDVLCVHMHTHINIDVLLLLFTFLCLSFEQRDTQEKEGTREWGSEDESLQRHRLQQRQQQYHTMCLGVFASVCERVCVPGRVC